MPFNIGEKLFSTHTNLHSLIDQMCIHFRCHGLSILKQSNEETTLFTEEEIEGYKKIFLYILHGTNIRNTNYFSKYLPL